MAILAWLFKESNYPLLEIDQTVLELLLKLKMMSEMNKVGTFV